MVTQGFKQNATIYLEFTLSVIDKSNYFGNEIFLNKTILLDRLLSTTNENSKYFTTKPPRAHVTFN